MAAVVAKETGKKAVTRRAGGGPVGGAGMRVHRSDYQTTFALFSRVAAAAAAPIVPLTLLLLCSALPPPRSLPFRGTNLLSSPLSCGALTLKPNRQCYETLGGGGDRI